MSGRAVDAEAFGDGREDAALLEGALLERALLFEGWAARFDRVDRAGDVIRRGAFAGYGAVPLLWHHRGAAIGRAALNECEAGLRVVGAITDARVAQLVRARAVDGLSVGYRAVWTRQGAWREILAAELVEVSLVAQPMQPGARVTRVWEVEG